MGPSLLRETEPDRFGEGGGEIRLSNLFISKKDLNHENLELKMELHHYEHNVIGDLSKELLNIY